MPENWKTYKLEDLGTIVTGKTPSSKHPEHFGNYLPFVTPTDFSDYHKNVNFASRYLSKGGVKHFKSKILPPNSILVTCIGSQMGKVVVNKLEVLTNQQLNSIIPNKNANSDFLYYKLSSIHEQLRTMAGAGSTMPMLNKTDFGKIEIEIPELDEQKSIASILSALDDKIELNLQMNKTLEEMAMALYKHWFVDFGPFQDGKFVDSELGEIPKGWEVKKLKDYTKNSQYGFTQSSSSEKIGPKFLRITDIQGGTVNWDDVPYCKTTEKEFEKYKIVKGDIFVARTGNSTGENIYTLKPQNAVFASYLIRFQFQELHQACYIAKIFRSKTFSDFINGAKVGSAQPGISASALGELQILIPPDSELRSFFEIVNPLDIKRETIFEENQTLTQLRDTLLPKLISGEVRVKDAKKTLTEVL